MDGQKRLLTKLEKEKGIKKEEKERGENPKEQSVYLHIFPKCVPPTFPYVYKL